MGQCVQGHRRSSHNYIDNGCCSLSCLGDVQLTHLETECNEYDVYCHKTPSTICDQWWSSIIGAKATINVCVMGQKGVGKSTLIQCVSGNTKSGPPDGCDPTSSTFEAPDNTVISVDVGDQHCDLNIQCLEELDLIYPTSQLRGDTLREGQIFLCCFSVDSVSSFQDAVDAHSRISKNKDADSSFKVLLVATKPDLDRAVDSKMMEEFEAKTGVGSITTLPEEGVSEEEIRQDFLTMFRMVIKAGNWTPPQMNGGNAKDQLLLTPNVSESTSNSERYEIHENSDCFEYENFGDMEAGPTPPPKIYENCGHMEAGPSPPPQEEGLAVMNPSPSAPPEEQVLAVKIPAYSPSAPPEDDVKITLQ